MRKGLLLIFAISSLISTQGQQNLSGSRQTSVYTYIYKLNVKEAKELFISEMNKFNEKNLHTCVDSFLTTSDDPPELKPGNYLFVFARGNELSGELKVIDDLQYKLVNNNRDLVIALHDTKGKPITNASVYIKNKRIPLDEDLQAFRINKRRKGGTITVYHNNLVHFIPVLKNKKYGRRQSFWVKIGRSFPLKYIVQPINNWFKKSDRYANYFDDFSKHERKFNGFMVFSKPIYKPGDTVQLKAFILNKDKKPVNRPLVMRLTNSDFEIDSAIAVLHPYRPGGYEYKFVITDTLDLTLDDEYMITLEETGDKEYNYDEYDGDLDDEAYMLQRKILLRGKFEYEEYELETITFSARSDKKEHNRGNPVSLYLKATDENEMAVMDGRVQLLIVSDKSNGNKFYSPQVFIPDTLWRYSQDLETIGETKIIIPDSIFPAATIGYTVHCTFLNSNNERQDESLHLKYDHNRFFLALEKNNDSLSINQYNGSESERVFALVTAYDEEDEIIDEDSVQLPAQFPINPFVSYYDVETDTLYETFNLDNGRGSLGCNASRTDDSVFIQVINPNHLFFWYTLFAGKKVIRRGYSNELLYAEKSKTPKNYFISLQYVYGNKLYNEDFTAAYQDKLLTINSEQPLFVYPGQTANISLAVTDAKNKPVNDADITAYSFTKKFDEAASPFVPYLGRYYPSRKRGSNFYENKDDLTTDGEIDMTWQRWSKEMGLDSIEYFRFLHTPDIYQNSEPARDSITQIAPFVVVNGALQPVHQLYIDENPVFFSQAQQLQRYSFRIRPGKHSLRIRTNKYMVKIDSIEVPNGVKTFYCFNADTTINKKIRLQRMPDSLTNYEKNLWSKYMILVENNYRENFSYISQNDRVFLLNTPITRNAPGNLSILAGPFYGMYSRFTVMNKFNRWFDPEGNYLFNISSDVIKQKQLPFSRYSFSSHLSSNLKYYDFKDLVLTEKEVDSLWNDYLDKRSADENLFSNVNVKVKEDGELLVGIPDKHPFIKNSFLFRYDDADFLRIYKGTTRMLGYLRPGWYRLLILFKDDHYFIKDSLLVKPNGLNYYDMGQMVAIPRDTMSKRIAAIVNNRDKASWRSSNDGDFDRIRQSFNEQFLDASTFERTVFGTVSDKEGNPIPTASVVIKGTRIGTITNAQGYFSLNVPRRGTLVFAAVGHGDLEKRLSDDDIYNVTLKQASHALQEVVVTGYGTARKKELAYSISTVSGNALQGKAAGLIVKLRGAATLENSDPPLIIIDGLPFQGDLSKFDTSRIAEIKIMKAEEAIALYGSKASGGVLLITTKKNIINPSSETSDNNQIPGNSMRRNFRDDAYWQPKLRTNREGKVSFNVTYPDDITNWRSFFIAVTDKGETGFLEQSVKSFKQLSTSLVMPQFLVEGDSANIIGKVLNYSLDSVNVTRKLDIEKTERSNSNFKLKNSWIDTFLVTTGSRDSLTLAYSIQKTDGYFDGEERTIPVFKKGVEETRGFFASLDRDTTITIHSDSSLGTVKIYAESSVLPVLLEELDAIRDYEYLCNEQLASKLKSLLLKKKVYKYLGKEFRDEKNIRELIGKLNLNKSKSELWGWWNNNEPQIWISLHVTEALVAAEKDGYTVTINKTLVTDYLVYNLEKYDYSDRISALMLLKSINGKVDYVKYIDSLDKKRLYFSLYEELRMLRLKQELGMTISIDSFVKKYHSTMFGNIYWGEDSYRFFNNSVHNTILMYKLMQKHGGYDEQLKKVRNYFLEKRKDGKWRNTYESSMILETILPDLLKADSLSKPASISINGGEIITKFPYANNLKPGDAITVRKLGSMPVYFTSYQKSWNPKPEKVSGDFTTTSYFERNSNVISGLKAGEPVLLKVKVVVRADADYVMVEVPIPAGCSYKDKSQPYLDNEVHREYFKNKVSIFCRSLTKGEYLFTVSLLPRYTGKYNLNPAKAEMMYFPVFYGREAMKKVIIH